MRIPTIEELKEINKLSNQIHKIHVKWRPDLYEDVLDIFFLEELKGLIEKEEILITEIDGDIVGYIVFSITERNKKGFFNRKILMIDSICVDEKVRGNGIGKRMIEYLLDKAKELLCTDVELTVSQENEYAIRLYESLGMKVKNIKYQMKI